MNTTIFVGYRTRGAKSAVVALIAFLLPSITYVIFISALYMQFHKLPSLQSALKGVSPVIVALILSVAYRIGKDRIKYIEPIVLMLFTIFLLTVLKLQVINILLIALLYSFIKIKFSDKEHMNENF